MTSMSTHLGLKQKRGGATKMKGKRPAVFASAGYRCEWCGDRAEQESPYRMWRRPIGHVRYVVTDDRLTVDHVLPLALGGSNAKENLMALCDRCNHLKGTYPYRDAPDRIRWYATTGRPVDVTSRRKRGPQEVAA